MIGSLNSQKILFLVFITIIFSTITFAQTEVNFVNGIAVEYDKCGYDGETENSLLSILGDKWGYSYDSLLTDLQFWGASPYVKIDSIGLSVQGRPIWQLTVSENPENIAGKRTVFIHARTHPNEVQSFWVTDEIINILLSETSLAQTIRANCVFYILPMYNPDGVELEYARQNANNIDIESNWNTFPHQPEVVALKARFTQLMASQNPIEVALNMHSAFACKRYFVFHDAFGTSQTFATYQQNYITGIRNYYVTGIQPWNYLITWTSSTPLQYPESWFWVNHSESVMALTYEDMNCTSAGNYDLTASAIVRGVIDYLGIATGIETGNDIIAEDYFLEQNYPNPFNPSTKISYTIPTPPISFPLAKGRTEEGFVTLKVYDVLGNEIATLVNEYKPAGNYEVEFNVARSADGGSSPAITSGVYFYTLQAGNILESRKMILMK